QEARARATVWLGRTFDQQRAAPPPVLRIGRIAVAPAEARARHPARRAAAEDRHPQPHPAAAAPRGPFAKSRKECSAACRAISSNATPWVSASTRAVSTT